MKSRSNSSNKDEKQAFEAKTFIDIKILFTGNVLWTVFTETELQINQKTFKKMMKLKNPNIFLIYILFSNVLKKWWSSKTQIYFWIIYYFQIISKFVPDLKFPQTALS